MLAQEYCLGKLGKMDARIALRSFAEVRAHNAAGQCWLILDGEALPPPPRGPAPCFRTSACMQGAPEHGTQLHGGMHSAPLHSGSRAACSSVHKSRCHVSAQCDALPTSSCLQAWCWM